MSRSLSVHQSINSDNYEDAISVDAELESTFSVRLSQRANLLSDQVSKNNVSTVGKSYYKNCKTDYYETKALLCGRGHLDLKNLFII